jgi:hypothetical protein
MPIVHPDDGSPFFQLARITVLQQANFALDIYTYCRTGTDFESLLRLSTMPFTNTGPFIQYP